MTNKLTACILPETILRGTAGTAVGEVDLYGQHWPGHGPNLDGRVVLLLQYCHSTGVELQLWGIGLFHSASVSKVQQVEYNGIVQMQAC